MISKIIEITLSEKELEFFYIKFCKSHNIEINFEIKPINKAQKELKIKGGLIPLFGGSMDFEFDDVKFSLYSKQIKLSHLKKTKDELLLSFIDLMNSYKDDPGLLFYGVSMKIAHYKSKELIKKDFFWSCTDELSPFGSDEGDQALEDYRDWRKENSEKNIKFFIGFSYLSGSWDFRISDYVHKHVLDKKSIKRHVQDSSFDDHYHYFTLDTCIIATCFGQFIDEGEIESEVIPILETSIAKLILWSKVQSSTWEYADEYIERLKYLNSIVQILKKLRHPH